MRKLINLAVEKYHDFQYHRKHLLENYPGTRGMVTNFSDKPCLILADTALKKDYFVYKQQFYMKHPFLHSFLSVEAIEKRPSLLLAEGDDWKRIRQIMSKTFNYDFIMSNMPLMNLVADQVFDKIKDLENVNLMNEFQTITGNVILSSMLGDDFLEKKYKGEPAPVVISRINAQVSGRRLNLITVLFGKNISKMLIPSFKQELDYQKTFSEILL